ncbi:MAG TPA: polyphenol oxidase family protein [Methylomirabilota bacterium]|jgi:YfiH family protein|nr:polyphenol oxidase family protein [Methylomirabilota bacterium]
MFQGSEPVRWAGTPPTHLALPSLEAAGVRHAFTTRHHGRIDAVSAAAGPFGAGPPGPALAALGIPPSAIRYARQVHGDDCLDADVGPAGLVGTADALLTRLRGRPLAVFTADCVPVVVADPAAPALGVAHAGWRGTVRGVAARLVHALVERAGARPERLRAALGPSIGPCCYEVDAPVVDPLRAAFPDAWRRWARPGAPGRWWFDLWAANAAQLAAAGVPATAILVPRLCTACRGDLFHSYRREKGLVGRLATIAVL